MKHGIDFLRPKDFDLRDDWVDVFVEIKDIRKHDIIFECVGGRNRKLIALTSARRISDGCFVLVKDEDGTVGELFYSDFTDYPAPSIFREPQYLTEVDKELVYLMD